MQIGTIQQLPMLRSSTQGIYLGTDTANEILLPKGDHRTPYVKGGSLEVFIYSNDKDELIASIKPAKLQVGEFAQLRAMSVTPKGAFMDWGLEPLLLVPPHEQKRSLEESRWYVTKLIVDPKTDRLIGSTKVEDHLNNDILTVHEKDEVELLVYRKSELGFAVIVNNQHAGLIHANEVFRPISLGDRITGYVKTIREDNKLDITVQPIGYRQFIDKNTELLAKRLQHSGLLQLTDKSSADAIYREFGISKKAFKKALGALYKERKVRIEEDGVIWIGDR